ncbi:MAG: ATP-binding protein [Bacteroidales bacterium]|nr:ATP-binding protein [Bacteroidales bacterium]
MKYRNRIVDALLKEQLSCMGAVLLEGAKWCGKTTTAEHLAKSVIYLNDPEKESTYLALAESQPSFLLEGDAPRLVDEWQMAPSLWDAARFAVDRRKKAGQFIFTGSSVPADTSRIEHSGAGRFAWLKMRPMSLWESGDSNGAMSLEQLFAGTAPEVCASVKTDLKAVAELLCRGGWPGALSMPLSLAQKIPYNYLDAVCNTDISKVDGVRRDASFTRRLLRSYARNQGQQVSIAAFYQDLLTNEGATLSEDTIASYIGALKKIFLIEDVESWNPNLRSKTAIRSADTRYFVDPSIATAALGVGPADLMLDLETFGLLFETLCVRDLRVYAEALNGNVYHYRDKNGLEADAVVHLKDGRYGLIEIKLGGESLINEGAKSLLTLANKIDTSKMRDPSFLLVLTAVGDFAYRRKDGVMVAPNCCLKN